MRERRGSGSQIRVENDTKFPTNWKNFLRCDENKESIFKLLANAIQDYQFPPHKQIISTLGKNAVSSPLAELSELSCSHEEADTRLLFHASHLFQKGFTKFMIHATDTDVVVIAIAVSAILKDCETWVAFGHGNKVRYIPCHQISAQLGHDASTGLLFFPCSNRL